jgi:hypothetical protein
VRDSQQADTGHEYESAHEVAERGPAQRASPVEIAMVSVPVSRAANIRIESSTEWTDGPSTGLLGGCPDQRLGGGPPGTGAHMTTTPAEPVQDPAYDPAAPNDPNVEPDDMPGEDPGSVPEPDESGSNPHTAEDAEDDPPLDADEGDPSLDSYPG